MKQLSVQVDLTLAPGLELQTAIAELKQLSKITFVSELANNEVCFDITYQTNDLPALWSRIREEFDEHPELAKASIVVCEGQHGWEDYLLLHHRDPAEPRDDIDCSGPGDGAPPKDPKKPRF